MARIVAGVAGGRQLAVPRGRDTRPTADRTREAMFSTLESIRGPLTGAAFLDLYAGSGAVGLEAASRGAAHVLLGERGAAAVAVIRANVARLALPGVVVREAAVARVLKDAPDMSYDVAFLDPPYTQPVEADLGALVTGGWLADDAVVVVERASRSGTPGWPDGIEPERSRRYGDSMLWYGLWYGRRP